MLKKNFIDYVKIFCRSGKGGDGVVHFHRDKITPKGGPDGGDGGDGGSVILRGNRNLWTLLHLKYKRHVFAGDGKNGSGGNKTGSSGEDVVIEVPLGTVAIDAETQKQELEIVSHDEEAILIQGGRGGQGNTHYKSATNQTPRYAQNGQPGIEAWKILELKLLADVGLVGFPNAGKSTLLSVFSAAKPKIADYPFTTLIPNLGIIPYRGKYSFVMADIPGIIEGAADGKGLGLQFLRHIERNALLLFMIPCDTDDPNKEYKILLRELKKFNPELIDKPRLIAVTKTDMLDQELMNQMEDSFEFDVPFVFISSITNYGLNQLKDHIWNILNQDQLFE